MLCLTRDNRCALMLVDCFSFMYRVFTHWRFPVQLPMASSEALEVPLTTPKLDYSQEVPLTSIEFPFAPPAPCWARRHPIRHALRCLIALRQTL